MPTLATLIINELGGTTAVAKLTEAPLSTVHSWRKNGIPPSRLAHMKLAAQVAGKPLDIDALAARADQPVSARVAA